MNLLKWKQKSLDDILSSFKKTINDLEELQSVNLTRAVANDSLVATLEAQSRSLREEANKAARVAENIEKLVA